jgi:tetratricopeptide (TPR) repeat protein
MVGLFVFSAAGQKPGKVTRNKPAPRPIKKLSEQVEWEKAIALKDAAERIAALRKFIKNFPKSARLGDAAAQLVTAEFGLANDKLAAGAAEEATVLYKAAVDDAPRPVPGQMWSDQLSKIAPNLYFRGAWPAALEIAKLLEAKSDADAAQLLDIASFYLSIESGSEAKRVADLVLTFDANSAAAYQTLGLAHRMDFDLEASEAAFAKALELQPDSLSARRGLAEMKRSLGKPDEAAALYREILAKDETNVPAATGLILSLFDAGKQADAEAEMAKSLDTNPGNVILLAGAAYWYAANNKSDRAVELARKAIESDARYVWSHIALARGLLLQGKPVDAEKVLLAARRYGNFPTLEYELASVRLAAGLYREAAEELAKSFSIRDGMVHTELGGRVPRDSKYFTELVGYERRASTFAPTAADSSETAAQLRALLELKLALDADEPNAEAVSTAADEFVKADDRMKVHREIYAAAQLLDKKIALPKVLEIVDAAPKVLDAGLDVPDASTVVLASELYESRRIAAARGDYIAVPTVPRATLSAVLRGRIEEIAGWASYQMQESEQAALRLRRAVGVLPEQSTYWRSSLWKLGTTLVVAGKDADGLEAYIKSYKTGPPDGIRYQAIEAVYQRVHGSTAGLDALIGPDPTPALVAQDTVAPASASETTPSPTPALEPASPSPASDPSPIPEAATPSPTPSSEAASPSPAPTMAAVTPSPVNEATLESPTPPIEPQASPVVPSELENAPKVVPIATPAAPDPTPTPTPTPTSTIEDVTPLPSSTLEAIPDPVVEASPLPSPGPAELLPEPSPVSSPTPSGKVAEQRARDLFPSVVITIPAPEARPIKPPANVEPTPSPASLLTAGASVESKPSSTPKSASDRPRFVENENKPDGVPPCKLTLGDETVNLQVGGGDVAVIVGRTDDNELDGLTATSTSPDIVSVRQQIIEGIRTRAIFVLHPAGTKTGVYRIVFEMPCGRRELTVNLR